MINKIKRFAAKNKFCQYMVNVLFLVYSCFFSFLCFSMRVFPVQENKIVCCNMKGNRYGDNPMYIADELRKRRKYEIVWILRKNVDFELPDDVRRARTAMISVAYELATAGVWIDSNTKQYGTLKRKKQIYIQTWHGSYGLKKVYGDIMHKISFIDKVTMQYNSRISDIYISNSKRTSEIYRRAFWYNGEILEYGSPRNDIFFKNTKSIRTKVDSSFRTAGKHIALYAPTFRNNYRTDDFKLDYDRMLAALSDKFGGEWVALVRLHPQNIADAKNFMQYTDRIMNATDYSIMQELLVASDVLITDYSSCMFDFVTTGKTCFIYATDIERYDNERGNYFRMDELPFPLAQNNDEMEENIRNFNQEKYETDLKELFQRVGLNETGHASERVADYIEKWMDEH